MDDDCARKVLTRWEKPLLKFARELLPSSRKNLAGEIVQTAFADYCGPEKCRFLGGSQERRCRTDAEEAGAPLHQHVRFRVKNAIRKKWPDYHPDMESVAGAHSEDTQARPMRREFRGPLIAALARLRRSERGEDEAIAVALKYDLAPFTYAEIATLFDISESAAWRLIQRGLKRLKDDPDLNLLE